MEIPTCYSERVDTRRGVAERSGEIGRPAATDAMDAAGQSGGGGGPDAARQRSGADRLAGRVVPVERRACPVAASLRIVGERWSLLVVRELSYGVRRFDQIVGYTGAPRDILADRLRKLVAAGVVARRPYRARPQRFEYYLTDSGEALRPVLAALSQWGSEWVQESPAVAVEG